MAAGVVAKGGGGGGGPTTCLLFTPPLLISLHIFLATQHCHPVPPAYSYLPLVLNLFRYFLSLFLRLSLFFSLPTCFPCGLCFFFPPLIYVYFHFIASFLPAFSRQSSFFSFFTLVFLLFVILPLHSPEQSFLPSSLPEQQSPHF